MEFDRVLSKHYDSLSQIENQISKYIVENKSRMKEISITELAEKSYTSKSSVLRFVQKLGFSGFIEFKYLINWDDSSNSLEYSEEEMNRFMTHLFQEITVFNHKFFSIYFIQAKIFL